MRNAYIAVKRVEIYLNGAIRDIGMNVPIVGGIR